MANENVVVNISATSDFSNLIADVNRVSATLAKLQRDLVTSDKAIAKNVQKLNADFANALTSSGQFSKYFVSLTSGAEKFGQSLDSGRLKLRDYFSTLKTHFTEQRSLISDLAKQQTMLQNALVQPLGKNAQGLMQYNIMVARGLDEVANKTKIAQMQAAIMNRVIQQGANQLINWGKNTQWAGRQLTVGLTVPLAAFGKAAADAFRLADKELVRLTKVYGDLGGSTANELGKIRDEVVATARELSGSLGASFRETLALAADVAATGKTGNELLGSVRETTRLAILGEVDRQEAMKATLAIQSAFKQNTEELTESINFLNAVENQTSTTLNDLVEAIPKAGPVIKGLGGDVQDLALYITAMREGGISASEGANALKSALASLINPTDVAVEKFKGFGIDLLGIVQSNAGNVTQTLLALQSALDNLDPLQKQQAIEQLFGKFQFSRLNALFENLGKQGSQTLQVLDLMKASTAELGAVADRELAMVTESASGRYARAIEKLKADLAGVGESFLGIATKIINVIDKFVNFVGGLPDPIKKVMGLAAGITAIAGPIIMLTGVLGNFFGYIIKGVSHFRALFKGAEGWKLLTPEILAANAAAQQIDDTFYSDAKAADVLKNALQNLINEYTLLENKVQSASVSLANSVTTVQDNPLFIGPREVDPNNPLIGPYQTRASAHMNPVAEMTAEQKAAQTFLGMVPSSIQVNRLIGQNPMILAQGDLPRIEGLTSITRKVGRGQSAQTIPVSTGVLSDEVAKWHAMTSALAMSSKEEIQDLKKSIAMTGVVTTEFMDKFDDILPSVTQITDNGARMSAAIVAELQAGKLTVQQARDKIIALNFEIERMLAEEVTRIAAARGVPINLANVPMINQPAANPVSGESNMRQMFRRDNEQFLRDLGTVIGVKTSGATYNVQTTRPKRLNDGGSVYTPQGFGNIVPGPNVDADVVPAMLTPGEFVVNRESAQANLPLLEAINNGYHEGGSVVKHKHPHKNRVRAHVTLPKTITAGQAAQDYAGNVNESFRTFASLYPNEKVSVKSNKFIRLLPEENDALKIGEGGKKGAGLTKGQLHSAIVSASAEELFSDYGDLDGKTKILLKQELEKQVMSLPEKGRYYDDTLAKVFSGAESEVKKLLPGAQRSAFASSMAQRDKARWISHYGFDKIAAPMSERVGGGRQMGATEARRIAGNVTSPTFYTSTSGKVAVLMPGGRKGSHARESGSSTQLSQKLWKTARSIGPIRRRNSGGMVYMNSGGMVPGYARGGKVATYSGPSIPGVQYRNLGGGIGRMLGQLVLSQLGFTGGSSIGEKVGGQTGQMIGGSLGSILPFMLMGGFGGGDINARYDKSIFAGSKFGQSMLTQATSANKLSSSIGKVALSLTRFNLISAGAVVAGAGLIALYKNHIESNERLAESYGLSETRAKALKLEYKDYVDVLESSLRTMKDAADRNRLIYESMASANTPLNLTIKQYKDLRKEVKQTMQTEIDMVNNSKQSELPDLAKRLKVQFMAAGMSAEEATKKIYMVFKLSEYSELAESVTRLNKEFVNIKNSTDAAIEAYKQFKGAGDNRLPAEAQLAALNTALQATDSVITKILDKNKKDGGQQKTRYQAEIEFLNQLKSKNLDNIELSDQVKGILISQNLELVNIVGQYETIVSLWQKIQIAAKGYTGDLKGLNPESVNALFNLVSLAADETTRATSARGGVLFKESQLLATLESQRRSLIAAQKIQSAAEQISSRKRIEFLQKEIEKINEAADARQKALQEEQDDEDYLIQIQKKKLEYQDALAAGDMSRAAQAQLDIQSLTSQQQKTLASRAIEEKRQKDIEPLQLEIDRINKANQDLADKAAIAADGVDKLNEKIAKLRDKIDTVNKALTDYRVAVLTGQNPNERKEEAAALLEALGIDLSKINEPQLTGRNTSPGASDVAEAEAGRQRRILTTADEILNKIFGQKVNKVLMEAAEVYITEGKTGTKKNPTTFTPAQLKAAGLAPGQKPSNIHLSALIKNNELKSGEIFDIDGTKYRVLNDYRTVFPTAEKLYRGGSVSGPGTSTSDSIPAYLSDGEYVINASAVDHYGVGTFDSLNAKKFYKGGYATSGQASFGMGMGWFGKTLKDAAFNVVKAAFGFDPRKSFKEQSGLEKIAMASLLIPGGSIAKAGTTSAAKKIPGFLEDYIQRPLTARQDFFNPAISEYLKKENLFVPGGLETLRALSYNDVVELSKLKVGDVWNPNAIKSFGMDAQQIGEYGLVDITGGGAVGSVAKIEALEDILGIKSLKDLGRETGSKGEGLFGPETLYKILGMGVPTRQTFGFKMGKDKMYDTRMFDPEELGLPKIPFGDPRGVYGKPALPLDEMKKIWAIQEELYKKTGYQIIDRMIPPHYYLGAISGTPKFHNWNGIVPGPYNKEISATLKAGTEGVYQNSYIASLKNKSAGNTYYNQPKIEVHPAPGMDESMLADLVLKKFNQQNARMAAAQGRPVVI